MDQQHGDPRFLKLLEELKALHIKKAADYGSHQDPLNNIMAAAEIGIQSWLGSWLRAKDKVKRIDQFCRQGFVVNESVEDSLMDLAAYSLITLLLLREGKLGGDFAPDHANIKRNMETILGGRLTPADKAVSVDVNRRNARLQGYDGFRCEKCHSLQTLRWNKDSTKYLCTACNHVGTIDPDELAMSQIPHLTVRPGDRPGGGERQGQECDPPGTGVAGPESLGRDRG